MRALTRLGLQVVSTLALGAVYLIGQDRSADRGRLTSGDVFTAATPSALREAAGLRVFFAHQSVGGNIVDGLPGVYGAAGVPALPVVQLSGRPSVLPGQEDVAGVFTHVMIGENGDPLGKIREFDTWIRSGLGERIDVALLKLCYIDLTADTDVEEVFGTYLRTLGALERDFPEVRFLAVTAPLTTEPALRTRISSLLGGSNPTQDDNVARQRFNYLLRSAYGTRVFDVAAWESTAPDGTRVTGTSQGQPYFALHGGYAVDEGHLDEITSKVMAARLLAFLAARVG